MAGDEPNRWLWRLRLAAATLVVFAGLNLPFAASLRMVAFAGTIAAVGAVWWLRLMIRPAPGESEAPLRRKQIALTGGVSIVLFVAFVAITTLIQRSPSTEFEQTRRLSGSRIARQTADSELGWGPSAPPGVVGQRFDTVDPGRPHILVMGDSIMYGFGVNDDETASHQLEGMLHGEQVLNAAVSGYSIDQYYLYLRRIVGEVHPRVIVVGVFTGNDFQITGREFSWGSAKPLYAFEHGELRRVGHAGECINGLARSLLFGALWRSRDAAAAIIRALCAPRQLTRGETEQTIAALFDAIDAIGVRAGARVFYVLLPVQSEFGVFEPVRFNYTSRHRDLRRILQSRPREVLDFGEALAHHRSESDALYRDDHAHFTPLGHHLLAETLRDWMTARGALPLVH